MSRWMGEEEGGGSGEVERGAHRRHWVVFVGDGRLGEEMCGQFWRSVRDHGLAHQYISSPVFKLKSKSHARYLVTVFNNDIMLFIIIFSFLFSLRLS